MGKSQHISRIAKLGVGLAFFVGLSACSANFRNHGYVPPKDDLEQVAIGIDTRASVEETLGPAASGSVVGDSSLYYVRSRVRSFAMLEPQVVSREVVAVSFDGNGVVENVERFGLERGQIIPLSRRVTESSVSNRTFLRQLLGNIGRIAPGGLGGG